MVLLKNLIAHIQLLLFDKSSNYLKSLKNELWPQSFLKFFKYPFPPDC